MVSWRPVLKFGDSCLREISAPVDSDPGSLAELFDELWSTLDHADGVGLAGPQIGIMQRALVVQTPQKKGGLARLEMANPVLVETFGSACGFEEGCLSFPGLYVQVQRPRGIKVEFLDRQGKLQVLRDQGLLARIVQHELDHLDGRLFIDHLSWWRKFCAAPRLWEIYLIRLLRREAGS